MNKKVKVLFLSSYPERLRADQELRDITEKIRNAPCGGAFDLQAEWAVRTGDVQEILARHKAQIVHFSGHGRTSSGIFLEDEIGKPVPVSTHAMRRLFGPLRGTTKLVILNACETRPLAEALRDTVDYVIAMRRPITDHGAIVFATQLYSSLGDGSTIPAAFDSAVTRLCIGDTVSEADIPDLVSSVGSAAVPLVRPPSRRKRQRDSPARNSIRGIRADGGVITVTIGTDNVTKTKITGKG